MDDANFNMAPTVANFPSQVFIYVGTKQTSGNEVQKAGLTNGKLYGVLVRRNAGTLVTEESNVFALGNAGTGLVGSGTFELVELGVNGDVSGMTGLQQEQDAIDRNILRMQRPEDAAWDPRGNGTIPCIS